VQEKIIAQPTAAPALKSQGTREEINNVWRFSNKKQRRSDLYAVFFVDFILEKITLISMP
jgi:hypothetical protein